MNILTVSKTIPFKGIVLDDHSKTIKAVLYELSFTLRKHTYIKILVLVQLVVLYMNNYIKL